MVAVYPLVVIVDYHGINFFEPQKEGATPHSEVIVGDEPLVFLEQSCWGRGVTHHSEIIV